MTSIADRSFFSFGRILSGFVIVALAGVLSACGASGDPRLADPQVDDVWVADLHQFSAFTFGDFNEDEPAWGLLRVVDVNPKTVTVITTFDAWDGVEGANDMMRSLDSTEFDQAERIPLERDQLQSYKDQRHIRRTRRP